MKFVAGIALVATVAALAAGGAFARAERASFVPPQMRGSWTKMLKPAALRKLHASTQLAGRWRMTIKANGQVTWIGSKWYTGELAASPGGFARLRFGCKSSNIYTWERAGTRLVIREAADKRCPPRVALFAGVWTKA